MVSNQAPVLENRNRKSTLWSIIDFACLNSCDELVTVAMNCREKKTTGNILRLQVLYQSKKKNPQVILYNKLL